MGVGILGILGNSFCAHRTFHFFDRGREVLSGRRPQSLGSRCVPPTHRRGTPPGGACGALQWTRDVAPGQWLCNAAILKALRDRKDVTWPLPAEHNFVDKSNTQRYRIDDTRWRPGKQVEREHTDRTMVQHSTKSCTLNYVHVGFLPCVCARVCVCVWTRIYTWADGMFPTTHVYPHAYDGCDVVPHSGRWASRRGLCWPVARTFPGFLRPAGRGVGTRNYIVVVGLTSLSSGFATAVAEHLQTDAAAFVMRMAGSPSLGVNIHLGMQLFYFQLIHFLIN